MPDYDGIPRPLNGNNSGEAQVDIGAFEFVHPEADSDGDGMLDWMELVAGTDPTDAASMFRITAIVGEPPAIMVAPSSPQRWYSLQYRTALTEGHWLNVDGQVEIPGGSALMGMSHGTGAFYRVFVQESSR